MAKITAAGVKAEGEKSAKSESGGEEKWRRWQRK
jgi:hypothetical protein